MNTPICRLCGHGELDITLTMPRAPRNIQHLLSVKALTNDQPICLEVRTCRTCGFVQLPPVLDDNYYDDYIMAATHSSQMQKYQKTQATEFVSRFDLQGKKVIEVGCGDGNFLNHLKAAGVSGFGVEPSAVFRNKALSQGLFVEEGYVTRSRTLTHGPFDAFVTRQVLEHVPEIHSFLTGIRRNLNENAVGLIEVPSLEKALEDRRYYDFFTDHVNYFSLDTLTYALNLNGFEVIDAYHDMFDEYNVALVRNKTTTDLQNIQLQADVLANDLKDFVNYQHLRGKKVGVWGAGGKGLSVLASVENIKIDALFDSDEGKQGRYTPVSHFLVQKPTVVNINEMSAIIVTAMAYRIEIEDTLRNDFGFIGEIAVLGHRLEVSEVSK